MAFVLRLVVAGSYKNRLSPGEVVRQPASESEYLRKAYIEIGDSQQYLELGRNLRSKFFFSWDGATPVTFRTPGYPILLALINNNPVLLFVIQSLLGALTVLFIFFVGELCWDGRSGIFAAILMAFDLPAIAHTGIVMSETLFVFLLVFSLWLFLVAVKKPVRFVLFGIGGALLGLAALTRPVALFAPLPFLILLMAKRHWRAIACFSLGFVLLCGGWIGRNYYHYHRLGFSSIGGYNLLFYNAAVLIADRDVISFEEAREKMERTYAANLPGDNPLDLAERLGRIAVKIILAEPLRYGKVYLQGLLKIITGIKSDEIIFRVADSDLRLATFKSFFKLPHQLAITKIEAVVLALVELLVTVGAVIFSLIAMIKKKGDEAVIFLSSLGWYFILAAAPLPDGRFKIPALPFFYLVWGGLIFHKKVTNPI
ncbi:MAG: ArnT family glycosyltransferase [bacterium]